ncbi:MAG: hypothetical protein IJS95_08245 [Prevotella sp.]|nr:hypothetical protein [Prevotella sp.]
MKNRFFTMLFVAAMAVSATAQISNTLSPYSQFGLGVLSDQSQGFNRGMGGLTYGLRDSKNVNMQNPASYSAIDSLTMIFDMGLSGQMTNFQDGQKKINAKTGDFDYAVALFRVMPKMGVSFGVVPYSNIGYTFYNQSGDSKLSLTNIYSGDGGFSQAYVGVGYEVLPHLSIGANLSYFWGKYEKNVVSTSSESNASTLTRSYSASLSSYKLDFGAQWQKQLNKDNLLTVGAVVGIGHKLHGDAVVDTLRVTNAFSLPFSVGVGASLLHKNSWTVGLDYSLQKWGGLDYPMLNTTTKKYVNTSGVLKDRHKLTVGADWLPSPSPLTRNFFKRIHYRAGISYATPYYNIGSHKGPTEIGVSAGFGIPIINSWNTRSVVNISAQWVHTSAKDLMTENTFRINIGLTFNERWFAKWKVD